LRAPGKECFLGYKVTRRVLASPHGGRNRPRREGGTWPGDGMSWGRGSASGLGSGWMAPTRPTIFRLADSRPTSNSFSSAVSFLRGVQRCYARSCSQLHSHISQGLRNAGCPWLAIGGIHLRFSTGNAGCALVAAYRPYQVTAENFPEIDCFRR